MKNRMNIAISLNQNYFRYTYVMLYSLLSNNQDSKIYLYVLHHDLTENALKAFATLLAKYEGVLVEEKIERSLFPDVLTVNRQWTIETYFRLALLDLLPEEVDRVLYIDVDTIVNQNLRELYETDFKDNMFVACMEKEVEKPADNCRWELFAPIFEDGYHYFNAGVMLWNVQALRGTYDLDYYLEVAKKMNYQFVAPDQDILNYVHHAQVKFADTQKYNLFARIASNRGMTYEDVKKSTSIIHYAGTKPWNADNVHFDIEMIWWDYAKQTPYYGELCEDFVKKEMFDVSVKQYVEQLLDENARLKTDLHDSLELNKKLMALIQR